MGTPFQDKYELIEPLGQGGMASVWRAKVRGAAGFERACVIKRILAGAGADEESVAMFVREARLCALLNHRNIVQVFDFGQADGEYYIAMEYVEGRDVLNTLRALRGSAVPLGAAVLIARELCRALAYAHELTDEHGQLLGLVHRDVSPANVLLASDGSVKLLDFGIAKAVSMGTSVTRAGTIKGKLSYMAPEQLRGGLVDGRADVFAAGIVLYELLVGHRLFRFDSDDATVKAVFSMEIRPPSAERGDVMPMLDRVCMRALDRDLGQRWPRAADMADALDPMVRDLGWDAGRLAAWLRALPSSGERLDAFTPTQPAIDVIAARRAEPTRLFGPPFEVTPTGSGTAPVTQRHRFPLRGALVGIAVILLAATAILLWQTPSGEAPAPVLDEPLTTERPRADPEPSPAAPAADPFPPNTPSSLLDRPRPSLAKPMPAGPRRSRGKSEATPRATPAAPSAPPAAAAPAEPAPVPVPTPAPARAKGKGSRSDVEGGAMVDPFSR